MRATAFSDAVPVRYAREQYALGFAHGRTDVTEDDALAFARHYVHRCEAAGGLVDVRCAYDRWRETTRDNQLSLFG